MPQIRIWALCVLMGIVSGSIILVFNFGGLGVLVLSVLIYTLATRLILTEHEIVYDSNKSGQVGIWGGIGGGLVIFITASTSALLDSYQSPAALGIILFASMGAMWSFGMKYKEITQTANG